jgi:hypothetical protein
VFQSHQKQGIPFMFLAENNSSNYATFGKCDKNINDYQNSLKVQGFQ